MKIFKKTLDNFEKTGYIIVKEGEKNMVYVIIDKKITVYRLRCLKCGNVWQTRVEKPVRCPYCKNLINWKKLEERKEQK